MRYDTSYHRRVLNRVVYDTSYHSHVFTRLLSQISYGRREKTASVMCILTCLWCAFLYSVVERDYMVTELCDPCSSKPVGRLPDHNTHPWSTQLLGSSTRCLLVLEAVELPQILCCCCVTLLNCWIHEKHQAIKAFVKITGDLRPGLRPPVYWRYRVSCNPIGLRQENTTL